MELKIYLRILLRRWWVILPVFLATFAGTVVFTFTQRPTYEAVATFIVAPTSSFEDTGSFVNGLDTLSRRTEIATTYAEVALSRSVRQRVAERLGLSPDQIADLTLTSKLRTGSNVLEIRAAGYEPQQITDFVNTVGAETLAYTENLYEVFDLKPLDPAMVPTIPVKPNKTLNLGLGGAFGLALGIAISLLLEYLQTPLKNLSLTTLYDYESGAYTRAYFLQRLREEMVRAKRHSYPLSLVVIKIDQSGSVNATFPGRVRAEMTRELATFLKQFLREEDIVARLEGTTFACLLMNMGDEQARRVIEDLQTRIAWTPYRLEQSGVTLNLNSAAGVVAYRYNGTRADELLLQAHEALTEAEAAGENKTQLFVPPSPAETD